MKAFAILILAACVALGGVGAMADGEKTPTDLLQDAIYLGETRGDIEGAMVLLRAVADSENADAETASEALYRLGRSQVMLEKDDEAEKVFKELLDRFPEKRSLAREARGHLAGIGARRRKASAEALYEQGRELRDSEKDDEAEKLFRNLLARYPEQETLVGKATADLSAIKERREAREKAAREAEEKARKEALEAELAAMRQPTELREVIVYRDPGLAEIYTWPFEEERKAQSPWSFEIGFAVQGSKVEMGISLPQELLATVRGPESRGEAFLFNGGSAVRYQEGSIQPDGRGDFGTGRAELTDPEDAIDGGSGTLNFHATIFDIPDPDVIFPATEIEDRASSPYIGFEYSLVRPDERRALSLYGTYTYSKYSVASEEPIPTEVNVEQTFSSFRFTYEYQKEVNLLGLEEYYAIYDPEKFNDNYPGRTRTASADLPGFVVEASGREQWASFIASQDVRMDIVAHELSLGLRGRYRLWDDMQVMFFGGALFQVVDWDLTHQTDWRLKGSSSILFSESAAQGGKDLTWGAKGGVSLLYDITASGQLYGLFNVNYRYLEPMVLPAGSARATVNTSGLGMALGLGWRW